METFKIHVYLATALLAAACSYTDMKPPADPSPSIEHVLEGESDTTGSTNCLGELLDYCFDEYSQSIHSTDKSLIYGIHLIGDTGNADIIFSARDFLPRGYIVDHDLIGIARHKNHLVGIYDHIPGQFESWYDKEKFSLNDIALYEATDNQMNFVLLPSWAYRMDSLGFRLRVKGDTVFLK